MVPLEEVQLRAEVTGQVTKILFDEGQTVTKGQQLYEINPRVYQSQYGEAQANVARARANYQQAQRDAERYTRLHEQDAIAKQAYENALTELESAKTQLEGSSVHGQRGANRIYNFLRSPRPSPAPLVSPKWNSAT